MKFLSKPDIFVTFQRVINNPPNQVEFNLNTVNTGPTDASIIAFVECIPK